MVTPLLLAISLARYRIPTSPESVVQATKEHVLSFDDNDRVRQLCGEFGAYLRMVEEKSGATLTQRGTTIRLTGSAAPVDLAVRVLQQLYGLIESGSSVRAVDVHTALRVLKHEPKASLQAYFDDVILSDLNRRPIAPRSPGQRDYVRCLRENAVTFGVGPAGTGKTYLAVAAAVAAHANGDVKRIILTRPAVEAGEKLGFLPGDLTEKVDPYLRPLFDAMHEMIPGERVSRMLEKNEIEVAPLAFMRGRSLNHAFVVLDEAQNTTVEQMKMFLTRLGEGSRMVINGDPSQVDLPRGRASGLADALRILHGVGGIGVVHLTAVDVVRHPLVASIVRAYDKAYKDSH